jgi:hypothetical protein
VTEHRHDLVRRLKQAERYTRQYDRAQAAARAVAKVANAGNVVPLAAVG